MFPNCRWPLLASVSLKGAIALLPLFGPRASFPFPFPFQAIETALDCLKSANTEPYYRRQAWEVIKCFLVAMMSLDDNKHALYQLLAHPK